MTLRFSRFPLRPRQIRTRMGRRPYGAASTPPRFRKQRLFVLPSLPGPGLNRCRSLQMPHRCRHDTPATGCVRNVPEHALVIWSPRQARQLPASLHPPDPGNRQSRPSLRKLKRLICHGRSSGTRPAQPQFPARKISRPARSRWNRQGRRPGMAHQTPLLHRQAPPWARKCSRGSASQTGPQCPTSPDSDNPQPTRLHRRKRQPAKPLPRHPNHGGSSLRTFQRQTDPPMS